MNSRSICSKREYKRTDKAETMWKQRWYWKIVRGELWMNSVQNDLISILHIASIEIKQDIKFSLFSFRCRFQPLERSCHLLTTSVGYFFYSFTFSLTYIQRWSIAVSFYKSRQCFCKQCAETGCYFVYNNDLHLSFSVKYVILKNIVTKIK